MADLTSRAIARALEAEQDDGFRSHLGASVIGRDCAREVWYVFRWAYRKRHEARMLRLFDRGHKTEPRFAEWLTKAGIHVVLFDPETGEQFRVTEAGGHGGGGLDALLWGVPDIPLEWVLGEFKSHNDKSFKDLKKKGVAASKWTHYVQMQKYMGGRGLRYALYCAVNKNDDEIYLEIIAFNPEVYAEYAHRTVAVVFAQDPPPRISNTPGWYKCKMCDFLPVCHLGAPLARNCRTCVFAEPVEDGTWKCRKYDYTLSKDEQLTGCHDYTAIE